MMAEQRSHVSRSRAAIIVETPLQLLCGYEAQGREKGETDLYLRLSGRGRNDSQLTAMARELFPTFQAVDAPVKSLWTRSWPIATMAMKLYRHRYERIYLGSYFSGFQRSVVKLYRRGEKIFLDDGMATLLAQKKIAASGAKAAPKIFSFFDIGPLPSQVVVKHEFERLRKIAVCNSPETYLDGTAIFVGQPLVERGYINKNTYLSAIAYAKSEVGDRWLYYIPHRHEDGTVASLVNEMPGCSVFEMDACIEWYCLINGAEPAAIFGFSTTALVTMRKLFSNIRAVAFDADYQAYETPSHLEDIRSYISRDRGIDLIRWDGSCFTPTAVADEQ